MPKQKKHRILGIDYGKARIGMAASDENKILATALANVNVSACKKIDDSVKEVEKAIEALEMKGYAFEKVVVGLPYKFNGSLGPMGKEVQEFTKLLSEVLSFPVISWDERLTTAQAEKSMREANMSRKRRSKIIDGIAAVLILQSYLDSQSNTLFPE